MKVQSKYPKLLPEMRGDRKAALSKAQQLKEVGLIHASRRYYEVADRIRRAIENIEHEDSVDSAE